MKIIDVDQGSLEWLQARVGLVTASEIDALVSPLWKVRKGEGVETYLAQKLAEKWTGAPLPGFMTLDMEAGQILEQEARPFAAIELGKDIQPVGLITDDEAFAGCSPDGLIVGERSGIEIKCPLAKTHVKYLLADEVPAEYMAQVQFSLYVTGYDRWYFLSYRRSFPPLIKVVEPDKAAFAAFGEALGGFKARFEASWAQLVDKNGGMAPKAIQTPANRIVTETSDDVIP